jgi:hypothetical protein
MVFMAAARWPSSVRDFSFNFSNCAKCKIWEVSQPHKCFEFLVEGIKRSEKKPPSVSQSVSQSVNQVSQVSRGRVVRVI